MCDQRGADSLMEFAKQMSREAAEARQQIERDNVEINRLTLAISANNGKAFAAELVANRHLLAGLLVRGLPLATRIVMRKLSSGFDYENDKEFVREMMALREACQHPFYCMVRWGQPDSCLVCGQNPVTGTRDGRIELRHSFGGREPPYLSWPEMVRLYHEAEDIDSILKDTGLTIDLRDTE